MSLVRVEVRNEYGLGMAELYKETNREDPKAVLDGVADAALVGILRQLGDLANIKQGAVNGGGFIVMSVLMRPIHVKLVRYLGGTKKLHTRFIVSNQCSRDNIPENNAVIGLYSKYEALGSMNKQKIVSWNVLMARHFHNGNTYEEKNLIFVELVEKGDLDKASVILRRMLAEDMVWNKATYIGNFKLCACLLDLNLGRQVHNKLLKSSSDVDSDESVCSAMINMYGNCEEILSARKVFDFFEPLNEPRNVVIWTAILTAYSEHGLFEESLYLFSEMLHEGVVPNQSTFSVLLTASTEVFSIRYGSLLHGLAMKTGCTPLKNIEDTLIDMYSRTGDIEAAEKVFRGMTYRDIISWNMIICGYGHHGYGICSLELFEEMLDSGEDPNCETFVGVLRACGHAQLVEEGFYYFNELMKHKGVKPGLEHYMCIVLMLIKARKLDKALEFIVSTPSKWDVFAWINLVGGYLAQEKYTLIDRVAELIPDDVATKLRKSCGVTDVYAGELHAGELMEILVTNELHGSCWMEGRFGSCVIAPLYKGDPGFDELHEDMKRLRAYVKSVTDRDDEVEDELHSTREFYHSEEIAIAYAVEPPRAVLGQPIRVIKASGKICPACHTFIR